MYLWLLIAHSAWRWVVLIAGFAAVVSASIRLSGQEAWAPSGPRLSKFFGIAVDIQALMGAALYLLFSPLTTVVVSSTNTALPPGSEAHFFAILHPAIMVAAVIAVHISSVVIRRGRSDAARQRRSIIGYSITLLIFTSGLPWWRPWLRLW